ncbi:MAG: hypothetical protein U0736_17440 [Gemmataceae bacterium]
MPNLTLRTTFIVGFPGETEAEFVELCDFVQQALIRAAGSIPLLAGAGDAGRAVARPSAGRGQLARRPADGTAASRSLSPTPRGKWARKSTCWSTGADPEVPGHYHARGAADAPEIDTVVRLKGKNLRPGDRVQARITGADGYDLMARAIRVRQPCG